MRAARVHKAADWLSRFVIAWILAGSLSHLLLQTAAPAGASLLRAAWVCAGALLFWSLLLWNRWCVLTTLSLTTLGLFLLRAYITHVLPDWFHFLVWAGLYITGWQPMNPTYADAFLVLICALVSLGAWLTCLRFKRPLFALIGTAAAAAYGLYFESPLALKNLILPTTACLLAIAQSGRFKRADPRASELMRTRSLLTLLLIPLFFATSLVPFLVMPADPSSLRVDAIATKVDHWVHLAGDEFKRRTSIGAFSISTYGFYPNPGKLGGSVTLSSQPVLAVTASAPTRLRGAVLETYTGSQWLRTKKQPLVRIYDGPESGFQPGQIRAFDLDLPDRSMWSESKLADVFHTRQEVDFRLLTASDRTLFVPGRLLALRDSGHLRPSFNLQGELYARRALRSGDTYTLTSYVLRDPGSDGFAQLLNDLSAVEPAALPASYEEYLQACLQLPEQLPIDVYMTAFFITRNSHDPTIAYDAYLIAQRITDYLHQEHFTYSLTVEDVPEGRDFVDWFLDSGTGYCTYFASAATILARCSGLPARYVEGFLMPTYGTLLPDGRAEYIVTGQQAHAWCEVYIRGAGWIPLDATPGHSSSGGHEPPTPSPGLTATITPTISPTLAPPDLSPTVTPPATGDPVQGRGPVARIVRWLLPAVLAIVGLVWWYDRRVRRYTTERLQRKLPDNPSILSWYWRCVTRILKRLGFPSQPTDTPFSYLRRLGESTHPAVEPALAADLRWLARQYAAAVYGAHEPEMATLRRSETILRKVLHIYRIKRGFFRFYLLDVPFGRFWPTGKSRPAPADE